MGLGPIGPLNCDRVSRGVEDPVFDQHDYPGVGRQRVDHFEFRADDLDLITLPDRNFNRVPFAGADRKHLAIDMKIQEIELAFMPAGKLARLN